MDDTGDSTAQSASDKPDPEDRCGTTSSSGEIADTGATLLT